MNMTTKYDTCPECRRTIALRYNAFTSTYSFVFHNNSPFEGSKCLGTGRRSVNIY